MSEPKLRSVHFDVGDKVFVDREATIMGVVIEISLHGRSADQNEYRAQWWIDGAPKEYWFQAWQLTKAD